ncbi:hypothetical protein B0J12DRAFT_73720 [Macrophomina phaseolina]|uniref:Uncharacterized protein n=1 Tax=Macrophomina phaseolina TaxID=35725 RepID=A0ABQ8FPT1_9PEZI|nr:hypothetical protein B0J12DRAFT_73720 [Macrophomina phaseolina]
MASSSGSLSVQAPPAARGPSLPVSAPASTCHSRLVAPTARLLVRAAAAPYYWSRKAPHGVAQTAPTAVMRHVRGHTTQCARGVCGRSAVHVGHRKSSDRSHGSQYQPFRPHLPGGRPGGKGHHWLDEPADPTFAPKKAPSVADDASVATSLACALILVKDMVHPGHAQAAAPSTATLSPAVPWAALLV